MTSVELDFTIFIDTNSIQRKLQMRTNNSRKKIPNNRNKNVNKIQLAHPDEPSNGTERKFTFPKD